VRWWNGKATGVGDLAWGMSQEPAAFPTGPEFTAPVLRPTGWSLGFGPRSLFLRPVCPCHVCVARELSVRLEQRGERWLD